MSASTATPVAAEAVGRRRRTFWWLIAGAAAFVALATVRTITGAEDLTSGGAVAQTLLAAVPILLAGLGGLWSERSGVVNIGLEGMMILGTWGGAWGALTFGPWGGVVAGVVLGAIGGLVHAVATVSFHVDHIVSGVAITIVAGGVTRYLSSFTFANMRNADGVALGGETQSPPVPALPKFTAPGVDALKTIEDHQWFLVSDVVGVVRGLLTNLSVLTIIAVVLVPLSYYLLWHTPFGLRLRSVGEHPRAAESLGVNVYLYKYLGVVVSGGLAGLGGAYLSMVASSIYREGQTGGQGYVGLAAMIFGNWRPGGLAAGAGLFGWVNSLALFGGAEAVHGLLLFLAIALVVIGAWQIVRGNRTIGGVGLGIAALAAFVWATVDDLPNQFIQAMPPVITLLVLALASQRLRMPAADGQPYRKGGD